MLICRSGQLIWRIPPLLPSSMSNTSSPLPESLFNVIINKCGLNGLHWAYISLDLCQNIGENEGENSKWVKGVGGLEHIAGSEGLDGQRGHWEMIRRIYNEEGKVSEPSEQPGQLL